MLEKYKGKEVRILVSSDSGAGTSISTQYNYGVTFMSSVITVCGVISDSDDKFLEVKNSKLSYMNNFNSLSKKEEFELTEFENNITLVNIDKIISVSLL